ncbi:MAG TPA: radical SAM protein [Prolixibacteraceae bacterium]|nr:radical SAM protein [Prolixibacteraceae bacterium]
MRLLRRNKTKLDYILFEATQQCNLNCLYCYNHWKRDNTANGIIEEGYVQSVKTLKKLVETTTVKHITFTGGEPFLAERIREQILFCRMKNISVSVITNGNASSAEELMQLIRIGVQLFELPVHSPSPSIHDQMTGVLGSWKKSTETIWTILQLGGRVVPVIVVTRLNYHKIGETLEFIHSLGISRVMLNRYNIGGSGVRNPQRVVPNKEQLNEAFQQANEMVPKLHLILSSNVCTPHCIIDPANYRNITFTNCSSDISKRPLTLTTKGELRFCNHSPRVLGNIFEQPINQILKEQTVKNEFEKQPEYCLGCPKFEKCLGGCRAAAEQAGKTLSDVDPLVEIENLVEIS